MHQNHLYEKKCPTAEQLANIWDDLDPVGKYLDPVGKYLDPAGKYPGLFGSSWGSIGIGASEETWMHNISSMGKD